MTAAKPGPRPARAQLRIHATKIDCGGDIRRLRHQARLSPAQRDLIIGLMMEREGLAGACARANIALGLVHAERRRNPSFRRALAAAEKQRLELLEMLLTDIVLRGLLADDKQNSDAREKYLSSLAQALIDRAASRKAESADKPAKAAKASVESIAEDELSALLAETERRIAEAEASLGDTVPLR